MATLDRRRGFGRTALAAGATVAAVSALSFGPAAGPAPAQDADTASTVELVVDPGRGLAGATVLSVAPATGALELAVTSGQARAETAGGLAQSLARSFSLGLIGSSLTAEGCDGSDPTLSAGQLPQALRADNRNGAKRETSAEIPVLAPVLGLGTEEVSADMVPSARAVATTGDAQISDLLGLGGGRSAASSVVLPGEGREAVASVEVDVDLAGVVKLTGLRWDASHRTGANPSAAASFSVGGIELGGVPLPLALPLEATQPVGELVNAVLVPLGFRVEMPQVERIAEPVDLIRVTPLRLLIADTPLSEVVKPALDLTRDFRLQLFDALVAADCSLASTLLVGDVVTGVASGTGALVLSIGGVEATSSDVAEENLLGQVPTITEETPAVDLGEPAPPFTPSGPVLGSGPLAAPTASPQPGGVISGPLERSCESTHPNRGSCRVGAATVAGLIGAVATAGTALLDLRRRRATSHGAAR